MAIAVGRACGKVILFGEHAVVYGVPAIAVGIDRGATASATLAADEQATAAARSAGAWSPASQLVLVAASTAPAPGAPHVPSARIARAGDASDLGRAFAAVLDATGTVQPVRVEARAELPAGAGLGCSAALGVAIVRALDALAGRYSTPGDDAHHAHAWEKVFHGNPSGIDTAVATRGGCLLFQRTDGEGAEGAPPSELRPILLGARLSLAIGNSGVSSSTRSMVESVARMRQRSPKVVDGSFDAIRAVVQNARLALEAGDLRAVGQLMDMNQMLLSGLIVSTEEIETMCRLARENGTLGAKLTGAGGGGCVIALCHDDIGSARVLEIWRQAGFSGFATSVAADGSSAAAGGSPAAAAPGETP